MPARLAAIATMLSVFALQTANAQTPTDSAVAHHYPRILGVFDIQNGQPIEDAQVTDVAARVSARTTKTGTVSLGFIEGEVSLIRVTKIGYAPASLLVAAGDTAPLTVVLTTAAQTLPTVVTRDVATKYVSPGLQAFEDRRIHNVGGSFVTEAELRKSENRRLSDVLRRMTGMTIQCREPACFALSTRMPSRHVIAGGACYVDVYLDGVQVHNNEEREGSRHNIDDFAVRDLAGVEFYAGAASLPPQYNKTGSSCGVMLLWTRER